MDRKTGIVIAVALAVAAVLYLVFSQNKTPGAVQTSIGLVPAGALTPLTLPLPSTALPISTQIANAGAVLDSAPVLVPTLGSSDLSTATPGVTGLFCCSWYLDVCTGTPFGPQPLPSTVLLNNASCATLEDSGYC